MKSLTRRAVLPILFLGVGFAIGACEDGQLPTTSPTPPPAPPPTPPAEPEPEPPPVPTGLRVAATGDNFIEWTWNAVEGAGGYEVHFSLDENFDSGDEIIDRNPEQTSYRRQALPAGTRAFVRVRSHSGTGEDRVESNWSSHVTGMTARPVPPDAPANLRVTERGEGYLVWAWGVVAGVDGYRVQYSLDDEQFTDQDPTEELPATQHSYRVENLSADMDVYLRVRAYVGTGAERLSSGWSGAVTGREPGAFSDHGLLVEASERVTEGETIEIQVAVSGDAGGPLRIQVAAEQDTVVDADYELLTPGSNSTVRSVGQSDGDQIHCLGRITSPRAMRLSGSVSALLKNLMWSSGRDSP